MLLPVGVAAADTARYERLIVPAAVWLGYRKELGYRDKALLGTDNWRSYALFAVCDLLPGADRRQQLFQRALDLDQRNLGARLNLAALLLQRPEEDVPPNLPLAAGDGRRDSWHERLSEAGAHLDFVAHAASKSEPIWFRAHYMMAVRHVYLEQPDQAQTSLDALHAAMGKVPTRSRFRRRKHEVLSELFVDLEPLVKVVALIVDLQKEGQPTDDGLPAIGGHDWWPAAAEYNLAGFWSRYAVLADNDADRRARTTEAIRRLRRTIERQQRAAAWAKLDPDFDGIREHEAFKAVLKLADEPAVPPVAATRYDVAVDPGPQLLAFLGIDESGPAGAPAHEQ